MVECEASGDGSEYPGGGGGYYLVGQSGGLGVFDASTSRVSGWLFDGLATVIPKSHLLHPTSHQKHFANLKCLLYCVLRSLLLASQSKASEHHQAWLCTCL